MAAITTGGSILDINTLVSSLMSLERRPLQQLASKEAQQTAKLSGFGQIKGALSSLQTATDALKKATLFSGTKATVSNDAGFTATSSAGAANGNYAIEVLNMAREQRVSTAADRSFEPAAGKLTIQFGEVKDGAFLPDGERTAVLEFEGGTLEELRDAINGNAALGIKANIINNGEHNQLVLTGTATGNNMAFRLTGEDGLEDLSFNPAAAAAPDAPMYSVQTATDARIKVDGIELSRGKNTMTDVIKDVTLTLTKEPSGGNSVKGSLSIAEDTSGAKSAIEAFVKAYNDAHSTLRDLTSFNTENNQASTLTGDATARNIQSQMRSMISESIGGLEGASSLAQIGITFDRSGILTIDNSKLDSALRDPAKDVGALFAGKEGVTGLASSISSRLDQILDSKDGMLASRTNGINETIKNLTKQYDVMEARLLKTEERYRLQYSKLDSALASMSQTSAYLTQQLASLASLKG
jgi:flagellar hook-associated protein 2